MEIRRAAYDDGPALAAIDRATWSPLVSPAPPPPGDRPFFAEDDEPANLLVAADDGEVVGYVMVHQWSRMPSHGHVLEINGLAVDPSHQGRGLGRALVLAAQEETRRRGARKLTLRVLAPNTPARTLYESCGFVVEGTLRGEFELDGALVDDVLMAWFAD